MQPDESWQDVASAVDVGKSPVIARAASLTRNAQRTDVVALDFALQRCTAPSLREQLTRICECRTRRASYRSRRDGVDAYALRAELRSEVAPGRFERASRAPSRLRGPTSPHDVAHREQAFNR